MIKIPNLSEAAERVDTESRRSFYNQNTETAIRLLDLALSDPQGLSENEIQYFVTIRLVWTRSLDETYAPPTRDFDTEIWPFWIRATTYGRRGQVQAELRTAWRYLQYCPADSEMFLDALGLLTQSALDAKEMALAESAAEMFVRHYSLLKAAAMCPLTPVSVSNPEEKVAESIGTMLRLALPFTVVAGQMQEKPEECWARILELAVYEVPPTESYDDERAQARSILQKYYERIGAQDRLARLQSAFAE